MMSSALVVGGLVVDLLFSLICSSLSLGRLEMFALAFFTFSTGAFSGDWWDTSLEI